MNISEKQRNHLARVVECAKKIREHLQQALDAHRGEVHFRPSSGGVAMVGLTPGRPQRGKSGIHDLRQLAVDFDNKYRKHCINIDQGRPTAEKVLQSWMIADAYRHDRMMTSLNAASNSTAAPVELLFVTDEIAILTGDGKIVCDILAMRETNEGAVPVIVELKTERQLKRLVEQVGGYAALVDEHSDLFAELYSATLGRPVTFAGPCEKWIIWPMAGEERDPREEELAGAGIRVVGYEQMADGFDFRVGE